MTMTPHAPVKIGQEKDGYSIRLFKILVSCPPLSVDPPHLLDILPFILKPCFKNSLQFFYHSVKF